MINLKHFGIKIDEFYLTNKAGTKIELFGSYSHLEIYQSIFQPFFYAELIYYDSQGVEEESNFSGNEEMKISFTTVEQTLNLTFQLYSIGSRVEVQTSTGKNKSIKLKFFEKGYQEFFSKKVSKIYQQMTIPDIIENHLITYSNINLKGKTPSNKTEKINFPMPYWTTNTMIKYLIRRAKSDTQGFFGKQIPSDVGYLYFRNNDGFNLLTVSDLISQTVEENMKLFAMNDTTGESDFNIDAFKQMNTLSNLNILKSLATGQFSCNIVSKDIENGNFELYSHKQSEYLNNTFTTNEWSINDISFDEIPPDDNIVIGLPSFVEIKEDAGIRDFMWFQRINLLNSEKLELLNNLNFKIQAGKMVSLEVKSPVDGLDQPMLTGNFLITDVIYQLGPALFKTKYSICADSYKNLKQKTQKISNFVNI